MAWTNRTVDADAAAGAPTVSAASAATDTLPFVVCEPKHSAQPTHLCANSVAFAAALL